MLLIDIFIVVGSKTVDILVVEMIEYHLAVGLRAQTVNSPPGSHDVIKFRLTRGYAVALQHGKIVITMHNAHIFAIAEQHTPRE